MYETTKKVDAGKRHEGAREIYLGKKRGGRRSNTLI
jgi:hypothetical protein